jgi:hypothetical protein
VVVNLIIHAVKAFALAINLSAAVDLA